MARKKNLESIKSLFHMFEGFTRKNISQKKNGIAIDLPNGGGQCTTLECLYIGKEEKGACQKYLCHRRLKSGIETTGHRVRIAES